MKKNTKNIIKGLLDTVSEVHYYTVKYSGKSTRGILTTKSIDNLKDAREK